MIVKVLVLNMSDNVIKSTMDNVITKWIGKDAFKYVYNLIKDDKDLVITCGEVSRKYSPEYLLNYSHYGKYLKESFDRIKTIEGDFKVNLADEPLSYEEYLMMDEKIQKLRNDKF